MTQRDRSPFYIDAQKHFLAKSFCTGALAMSTPPLRVELSREEDRTLQELRAASGVPQRTKDRAEALRLSHRGWTPDQIADYLGWQVATARKAIHRWQQNGLSGLLDRPRGGDGRIDTASIN